MAKATKTTSTKARVTKTAASESGKDSGAAKLREKSVQPKTKAKVILAPAALTEEAQAARGDAIVMDSPAVADPVAADRLAAQMPDAAMATADDDDADTPDSGNELKKRELLDLIVTRTGVKKRDAKPVMEAMLTLMSEAITAGRELNLEPMGKLKTNRIKETENGRITIMRLKQSGGANGPEGGKQTLAETED